MFEKIVKTFTYTCLVVGGYHVSKFIGATVEKTAEKIKDFKEERES